MGFASVECVRRQSFCRGGVDPKRPKAQSLEGNVLLPQWDSSVELRKVKDTRKLGPCGTADGGLAAGRPAVKDCSMVWCVCVCVRECVCVFQNVNTVPAFHTFPCSTLRRFFVSQRITVWRFVCKDEETEIQVPTFGVVQRCGRAKVCFFLLKATAMAEGQTDLN